MTLQQAKHIEEMISARLPKNWSFSFVIDEDDVLLIYQSPKYTIRINAPIPKNFDDPLEAFESITLKYLNGRFYK